MSGAVLAALKADHAKKQSRIDQLDNFMHTRHLDSVDAKAMDGFARRFNAATTWPERESILKDWKPLSDKWNKAVERSIHQSENYMKWADEQMKLMIERDELASEIGMIEFRNRITAKRAG